MSGFNTIGNTSHSVGGAEDNIIMPPVLARPKLADLLADLLAQVTPENLPDDADVSWGKPQSTEE